MLLPQRPQERKVSNVNSLMKKRTFGRESSLGIILIVAIGITGFINPRFVTGDGKIGRAHV